ncbi:MAG: hypothetical protein ACK5Z5_02975 [Neisseriaceae bacterium]
MRYVIDGFLQTKLIEFKINERERKLLEFIGFVAGGSKTIHEVINGKSYFWFKYKAFISEYPYLEIPNTMQVGEHVKKLKEKGIIDLYIDKTPHGTFTYVAFNKKYYELISSNSKNYNSDPEPISNEQQAHSDLDDNPHGFDVNPTRIKPKIHSDLDTHSDSNPSGNETKSEWNGSKIRAETVQNPTQKNQPTMNQTTINQSTMNLNSTFSKNKKANNEIEVENLDFNLEDLVTDSIIEQDIELSEEQINKFISWIHLRKKQHKKLINNSTTILKQLKRLASSMEFAGIDYILDSTIAGSDKTGKCYENILEITKSHPSKQNDRYRPPMSLNPQDGFYYAEGLPINGYIDRKGNGSGYINGIVVSEDARTDLDPFWFDHLPEEVKQERLKKSR